MEYNEVKQTIKTIKQAIKKGDYSVTIHEPNNIMECTALDGRTFYKVMDMDDATSGNDFGSCEVKVAGYEFSCDFETGECESTFFDEINDEYKAKNGRTISKDRLIGETLDAFYKSKDILWGTYVEPDEQMMVYAKVERLKNPEYYWGEDDCCPLEEGSCSLRYPEDLGCGEVEYDGSTYYLVEDTSGDDGEEVLAVEAGTEPDDQGVYEAVTLTLEYDDDGNPKVVDCEDGGEYDAKW